MMDRTAEYSALGFPQLCKFVEKSLRRHYVEKEDAIEVICIFIFTVGDTMTSKSYFIIQKMASTVFHIYNSIFPSILFFKSHVLNVMHSLSNIFL